MGTMRFLAHLIPLVAAIQPSAHNPVPHQQLRDLEWGQLNFLHTTDNHGWHAGHLQEPQYSADFGDYISFVSHMRRIADERGVDLLVLDTGDRAEGNGLWDATDPMGRYTRAFFHRLDMDVLTLGNHELYKATTAENEFLEMIPYYEGKYIASNVDINVTGQWEPLANRSRKFVTKNQGIRITSFGFLFNFDRNANNTRVQMVNETIQEAWFQSAIHDPEVDLFLIIGHVDINSIEYMQLYKAIRGVHPHMPIQFFGGHSHIRNFRIFDAKSTALESGRYCETVGWLSIGGVAAGNPRGHSNSGRSLVFSRRYIDANRAGYQHHSGTNASTFDTPKGLKMTADLAKYREELDLDRLIGCAPQDFSLSKHIYPGPDNWYSFLEDHVLPTMVYNPERNNIPHLIFINSGSQRFDVFKGRFTYDTSFLVSPFTSIFLYAKDIEWGVAQRLGEFFENDRGPYITDSVETQGNGGGDREAGARDDANADDQQILEGGVAHRYNRVRGYETSDDAGESGDDTVHIPIEHYKIPNVIQANASFPAYISQPLLLLPSDKIDVVFIDFIAPHVARALDRISGKQGFWKIEDFEPYMGLGDTMTKLLLQYVERYWSHDC